MLVTKAVKKEDAKNRMLERRCWKKDVKASRSDLNENFELMLDVGSLTFFLREKETKTSEKIWMWH